MLEDDWRRKFNVKTQRCSQDFFLPRRKKLRPEVRGSQGRERRGFLGREHSQPPYPPGPRAEGFLGREQPAPLPTRAESGRILGKGAASPYPPGPRVEGVLGEGAVSPYPPGPRVEGFLGREQPALPTRAQSGVGSWERSSQPPTHQGSGDCCKLPKHGPGRQTVFMRFKCSEWPLQTLDS